MTLIVALIVFSIWSIYRLLFPENLLLDEAIIKPIIWLLPVFFVTKFKNLGFKNTSKILINIVIGLSLGLVLAIERLVVKSGLSLSFSWVFVATALLTALTEEIFFRGFLLNRWLKYFKSRVWLAMLLNGLFFTFTHLPIALFRFNYRGYDLFTYLLTNFISGFADVILYVFTGSIYASVANHFVWNTFSSLFR